ncbi:MAG: helix-turn-helix domain-containing protein [Acidobacteria bacterium]|nr:helix-turn-helix domain-containing protein [Acidobacteriota bacterium]
MAVLTEKEQTWDSALIRDLRGKRTQSEFGQALGVPKNTVWRWETGRCRPDENHAKLLSDLASREDFLADWRVFNSLRIMGDLEEGSREIRELFEESLERNPQKTAGKE